MAGIPTGIRPCGLAPPPGAVSRTHLSHGVPGDAVRRPGFGESYPGGARTGVARRLASACMNTACSGNTEAQNSRTRRTVTVTLAASLSSRERMVSTRALDKSVPFSPKRRRVVRRLPAKAENADGWPE